MSKPRDAAKERHWRRILRQQAASGLGTRRFCVSQGIAEHQFHWWRRTIRRRDQRHVQGRKRRPVVPAENASNGCGAGEAFIPVRLPISLATPLEVVHPRGHVIRVPAVFDPGALRRILEILDL